jgi:hypothetical protein
MIERLPPVPAGALGYIAGDLATDDPAWALTELQRRSGLARARSSASPSPSRLWLARGRRPAA